MQKLDTEVLSISVDHIYSHNVFEASLGTLPFPLLSDWFKKTAKDYGVFNPEDETAKRSVFVINKEGKITFMNTQFKADEDEHYTECLEHLERL